MSTYRSETDATRSAEVLLVAASMFSLFSFVLAMLPYQTWGFMLILLAQPGRFLFRSFHYAGVVVPLMLYVAALAVRAPRFRLDWIAMVVLSPLPMGAAAVALRIWFAADPAASPVTAAAVGLFGAPVAAGVAAAAAVAGTLAILRVGQLLPPHAGGYRRGLGEAAAAGYDSDDDYGDYYQEQPAGYAEPDDQDESPFVRDAADTDVYDPVDYGPDDERPAGVRQADPLSTEAFNRLVLARPRPAPLMEESASAEPEISGSAVEPEQPVGGPSAASSEEDPVIHVRFPRSRSAVPTAYAPADDADDADDQSVESAEPDAGNGLETDFAAADELDVLTDAPDTEVYGKTGLTEGDSETAEEPEFSEDDESGETDEIDETDEVEDVERERDARILAEAPPPKRITRGRYSVPVDGLLDHYENQSVGVIGPETRASAQALKETLQEFNIEAEVTGIRKGPVITMFEILPAPGVKLAKISSLADNIALRLAAQSVRIVAPIPGKHAVGIEIPNQKRSLVSFGELLHDKKFTKDDVAIPLALGKDIPGDAQIVDLAKTPHLLIAGATGSGKSVCVNSIICSILYRRAPEDVRLILIDPKIVELKFYNDIPHLLTPVITDPKRAFQALQYAIYEMERRYSLLDAMGVRDIASYNRKIKERKLATASLPYIVIIVDEFADLMATSGKELESTVARLCAMSRAVGIHLVLATQRPSTDVITGLIKANIPSRIAFMVASKVDSRIIIDTGGAEKLLGRGDMLFTSAWDPFPFRMQGAFLSEDEVERIVSHVKTLGEPDYIDDEIFIDDEDEDYAQPELEDPLMEKAIDIVVTANKASASYLQRRLKIGYNRAARLVEEMERVGIVGPQNGSKARDVIGAPD